MANLDSLRVYDSIIGFANQVSTTWTQIAYSTKLDRCSRAENIVISGMGGSALGGRSKLLWNWLPTTVYQRTLVPKV